MALDVMVRLKDSLSSPLRGLMRSLEGVTNMAKKIGVVGTAIAAISFMAPIQEAAAFQQKLVDIAGTANLSGGAAFAFVDQLKGKYEGLALTIGQHSDTIANGAGQMIAAGLDPKIVDASMLSIGRASTAAHADFADMAGVATSLLQTLKLPVNQLDGAMAGFIVSGKEGAFEMKNMAKYLPTLTGQMAKFGIMGRDAVNFLGPALQIAMKGTSDPAEAANNLKNFLSKVMAPATVKNFKDMGVDIEAVMKNAAIKGINPIEAVIQKITMLTGTSGNEIAGLMKKAKASGLDGADALAKVREQLIKIHGAGKLGGLFQDQQVMDFLIPMLGNIEEYKRIKDQVTKATGGMIDKDFETQMLALNQQMTIFSEIGTQAWREVGFAFGTWLPMINDSLSSALKQFREWDTATGGALRQALSFAGAGILAAGALGALGVVLPVVGAGLALLASPVGLVLGGLAVAGALIYRNWATIGPRLSQIWGNIGDGFRRLGERISYGGAEFMAGARVIASEFGGRIAAGMRQAWTDIKKGWDNLKPLFDGFRNALGFKFEFSVGEINIAVFKELNDALKGISQGWEDLKRVGDGFRPYLKGMGEDLGGTVKAVGDFGNNIKRLIEGLAQLGSPKKTEGMYVIDVDKMAGDLAGGALGAFLKSVREISEAFVGVSGDIADLVAKVNAGIEWNKLLPEGLVKAWNDFAGVLEKIKGLLDAIGATGKAAIGPDGKSAVPGMPLPNGGNAGDPENGTDRTNNLDDYLNGPPQMPGIKKTSLAPAMPSSGGQQAAARTAVDVGGVLRIELASGLKMTASTPNTPGVSIVASDTGRAVGRV